MVGQHIRKLQKEHAASVQRLRLINGGIRGKEALRAYAEKHRMNFDVLLARMAEGKRFAEQDPDAALQAELLKLRNQEETILYLLEVVLDEQRRDQAIPEEWWSWIQSFISPSPLTVHPSSSLSQASSSFDSVFVEDLF